jgi:hypothetical protein
MSNAGPSLRIERTLAKVTATDLAAAMKRPRQWVHELEGRYTVKDEDARAYRLALRELVARSTRERRALVVGRKNGRIKS